MRRFVRFYENLGVGGALRSTVLFIVLVVMAVITGDTAQEAILFAVLFGLFFLPYLVRHWLVRNCQLIVAVLKTLLPIVVAGALVCKYLEVKSFWTEFAAAAFLGGYMGVQFWLLSDPRIARE